MKSSHRRIRARTRVGFLLCVITGCNGGPALTQREEPIGTGVIQLERVVSGLDNPLYVTTPPGDTTALYIVEKTGRVVVFSGGALQQQHFLDVSDRISNGGEQGLLSLAFHPQYASNGRVFIDYTDRSGDTQVVEYRVNADRRSVNPATARTILTVAQPYSNHNGGLVVFGPDGYLYIGLGDGGAGGDPQGHAQNIGTLLGSILRIDVNGAQPYAVPANNPFVGRAGARTEIWAYGLRNPWRFSFDRQTNDLYIADVGQNQWEEVNVEPAGSRGGVNYGWNRMEGRHCYRDPCDATGLALPVFEYNHDGGECSVTGGHVYRGQLAPSLRGHYVFGDFCGGVIRSFRIAGGSAQDVKVWSELGDIGRITSFGEDARGDLYVTTQGGEVLRFAER